jgi:uncharacterized protein (DUF1684 family)
MTSRRFLIATVVIAASTVAAITPPDSAYQNDFDKWKQHLTESRKRNWLSLVGLFWMKPGANKFGSANDNDIVLPSVPLHAATFLLRDNHVSVVFPDKQVEFKFSGGESNHGANLQADDTENPTLIEYGSLRMHMIRRGERVGLRVKDMNNPKIRSYAGPTFFPIDLHYRVTAKFVPSDGRRAVEVPNVLGDVMATPVVGEVDFTLNGQDFVLTSFEGDAATGLSFVISDLTSKTETYPGGRFLDTDAVKNGEVTLDFNRAYSPPCSVTPYATCPLAPKENRLSVALPVGEKYDRTHGHH